MSRRSVHKAFSLSKRRATPAPHRVLRVESLERREVLAATNWMELLPDDAYLSELSLPGTHDTLSDCDSQGTCTVFTNVARAQNRTLSQQLQDGIRVLDVRVDHAFSGTTVGAPAGYTYFFGIVHGMVPMGHEFRDDVLKVVADFMAANPSETIVMQIQEQDALTPATGRAFIDTFEQYMNDTNPSTGASYGDLFWQPGADRIPTLGEVRGKIVLMQDDWDGLESKDSPDPRVQRWGLDYTRNDDGEAGNPNYYNGLFQKVTTEAGLNVNDRWADSLEFFAETRDAPRLTAAGVPKFYENSLASTGTDAEIVGFGAFAHWDTPIEYTTGKGCVAVGTPRCRYVDGLNQRTVSLLDSGFQTRTTGMIFLDFYEMGNTIDTSPDTDTLWDTRLIDAIIDVNQFAKENYRINAGGPAVSGDRTWEADNGFSVLNNFENTNTSQVGVAIDTTHATVPVGTPEALFQTERWDPAGGEEMQWSFPVIPGDYEVRLYFVENFLNSANARVFDVSLEGANVLADYDIYADVGLNRGVVKTFRVSTDEVLDIEFGHEIDNPQVSAIEVRRVLPENFRVNVGGRELQGNPTWRSDEALESLVTNGTIANPTREQLRGLDSTNSGVPSDYGSRFAPTPNLVLSWSSSTGVNLWEQYDGWPNDPGNGVFQMEDGALSYNIAITPDAGWDAAISSFDLNNWGGPALYVDWSIVGAQSGLLRQGQTYLPGEQTVVAVDTTGVVGVNGEVLTLNIASPFGGNDDELAMDNLVFQQVRQEASRDPSVPAGTPMEIFRTERYLGAPSEMRYDFAVDPGLYFVNLYFTENFLGTTGARVFDVVVEGTPFLVNYDIFAVAGEKNRGVMESLFVSSDENLSIEVQRITDAPQLSGIEIIRAPDLTGDYNLDGVVNAADYTIWRDTEGQTVPAYRGADGNGNGIIDSTDRQLWVNNYGSMAGSSAATSVSTHAVAENVKQSAADTASSGSVVEDSRADTRATLLAPTRERTSYQSTSRESPSTLPKETSRQREELLLFIDTAFERTPDGSLVDGRTEYEDVETDHESSVEAAIASLGTELKPAR